MIPNTHNLPSPLSTFLFTLTFLSACSPETPAPPDPLTSILADKETLADLPFPRIVRASSGRNVIAIDPHRPVDAAILASLDKAMPGVLARLNAPDGPARKHARINEVSREAEDLLLAELDALPGFTCTVPLTSEGDRQRSGYPDLRLLHEPSGRVAYIDPKLFEAKGMTSTLRTFYYEPDPRTGKILEDAHHIVIGIAHDGRDGAWAFTSWHAVDLHGLTVRLKAEFQASNRDLYRPELIISGGER